MTPSMLKAWRARLSLGEAGMAAYLGVPVTTYRKWENGTRSQDASTRRLFEVLQRIEDFGDHSWALHTELLAEATAEGAPDDKPKRKPRSDKGTKIAAPDVPDWMKGGV